MLNEDLKSLPGLQENHRRGLVKKLGITSARALADADPDVICAELQNLRPPPSRAQILQWQHEAQSRPSETDADRSDWRTAASFAVIFAQRLGDAGWERRIQAQQTEVDPEPAGQEWPDWDCGALGDWMHAQLPLDQGEAEASLVPEPDVSPAVGTAADVLAGRTQRVKLRIDSATITDAAAHELNLIAAGRPSESSPADLDLVPPVRLSLKVTGARSGQQVQAAVWLLRQAGPGWSPVDPVTTSASGEAQFDLASVPAGEHRIRLLAWAADAGAALAGVTLPKLTLRQVAP